MVGLLMEDDGRMSVEARDRQAIILVGEYNYGRFPLGAAWPRAVVPVLNRPQLWHVLKHLGRAGFGQVAICGNGSTMRIREELAGRFPEGMILRWVDGPSPRGAAGCVRDAYEKLDRTRPVFVVEGSLHPQSIDNVTVPTGQSSGIKVYYGREDGSDAGAAQPAGMYWVWPDVMPSIPEQGFCDLKQQLLPTLRRAGIDVRMQSLGDLRPRLSTLSSYLSLNYSLLVEAELDPTIVSSLGSERLDDAEVWVDGPCQVDASAQFAGPVLLGRGVRVEADCVVVGPTVIGDGTVIERGAYIRDSVVWRRTRVGEDCELTGVLAVDGVEIESGTTASYMAFVDWDIDMRQAHEWQMAGISPVRHAGHGQGSRFMAWQRTAAL